MLRAIACSCFNIRGKHAVHGNYLQLLVRYSHTCHPWQSTAIARQLLLRCSRRLFQTPFYLPHPWGRTSCIRAVVLRYRHTCHPWQSPVTASCVTGIHAIHGNKKAGRRTVRLEFAASNLGRGRSGIRVAVGDYLPEAAFFTELTCLVTASLVASNEPLIRLPSCSLVCRVRPITSWLVAYSFSADSLAS